MPRWRRNKKYSLLLENWAISSGYMLDKYSYHVFSSMLYNFCLKNLFELFIFSKLLNFVNGRLVASCGAIKIPTATVSMMEIHSR